MGTNAPLLLLLIFIIILVFRGGRGLALVGEGGSCFDWYSY
jgi:hypothetical protein